MQEKQFYNLVSLKPVGEASRSLLESNEGLKLKHWEHVKEFAEKRHPDGKTKPQIEAWLKKAVMTPEQEVVMWYEASLRNPLSHEGYEKYMVAFEKVIGKDQFKRLMGADAVSVVKTAKKQEKELLSRMKV
jgi:hypothetical protein